MPELNLPLTNQLTSHISDILQNSPAYEAAKQITRQFLGAKKTAVSQAQFGFWVPGLVDGDLVGKANQLTLELFTAVHDINFSSLQKEEPLQLLFNHAELQLAVVGDYMVGVVDGVSIGTKSQAGSFYWLRYDERGDGSIRHIIRDPLVSSSPFGVYAPAELFDMAGMLAERQDTDYFHTHNKTSYPDGSVRARDIGTHLEIHPETATAAGTLAALTARYREIGRKLQANIDAGLDDIYANLPPADLNFIAFDTIELTPEVPPAEREGEASPTGEFFQIEDGDDSKLPITLKRPDISNWGYDTPILGSAAVSPSILGTLRPNEFLEFIETIHRLPGRPIQLCIDSVLGHCDFQGARLLRTFDKPTHNPADLASINSTYLTGSNMYGRDIDFTHPQVKAMLLELLVRKLDYGFDCVRVDGAQDFVLRIDEVSGLRIQEDAFLNEMACVTTNINGLVRRLDMNLEDGRPWPDDLNWLYNSKYLDHTIERRLPFGDRVKQWSPIIFAHNVHGKYKWFLTKWDRFVEVFRYGADWITGHSNHDNYRYFYRLTATKPSSDYVVGDDFANYYNDQLGETMVEVAHNAMDNGALTALTLGFLPGNPMFMLNALFHTPWTFIRDTDATYGVKVVAEEASRYFSWYVDEEIYGRSDLFLRLKKLGFTNYRQLVAPPANKGNQPAFADWLLIKRNRVRTDVLMVRFLYDDPHDSGGYDDVTSLTVAANRLTNPHTTMDEEQRQTLQARIEANPPESARRVEAARKHMAKSVRFLQRDLATAPPVLRTALKAQLAKLAYLKTLPDETLALLIEDAEARDEYGIEQWASDEMLSAVAPQRMLGENGRIAPSKLRDFATAFMLDARDAAKVHRYEDQLDEIRVQYNFGLRRFRQQNEWLRENPTNDVRRDYFARKLYINGAKDLGDWGDIGDIINCNTIYYGWRTSPDDKKQLFLIANMEGKPLEACPLYLFLNLSGTWRVAAHSPTLAGIPATLNKNFIIHNFKNGEALLLEREI